MARTYTNGLRGFKQWCKEYRWNSAYEDEKEFHKFTSKGTDYYLELSLNEFGKGDMMAFVNYRVYDYMTQTFVSCVTIPQKIHEKIEKKLEEYSKKKNAVVNW